MQWHLQNLDHIVLDPIWISRNLPLVGYHQIFMIFLVTSDKIHVYACLNTTLYKDFEPLNDKKTKLIAHLPFFGMHWSSW